MSTLEDGPRLDYNAYQLAHEVGVSSPDSSESPGAEFLLDIQSDVNGLEMDELDPDDGPHEVADSCVPIGTYYMWRTFVDLCAWEWEDDIGGSDDMSDQASSILYQIGRQLAAELIQERIDGFEEDDDDGE